MTSDRWISANERLPEDGARVLVIVECVMSDGETEKLVTVGEYESREEDLWLYYPYKDRGKYENPLGVTHWMPLPEPPEDES